MEIEFEFEMEDWMALQKNHLSKSKQGLMARRIATAIFLLAMVYLFIKDYIDNNRLIASAVVYGLSSILWLKFFPGFLTRIQLYNIRKSLNEGDNSGLLGHHKIVFDQDKLNVIHPESEYKVNWKGIKNYQNSKTHLFLYTSSNSAIVIPKHKIGDRLEPLEELLSTRLS